MGQAQGPAPQTGKRRNLVAALLYFRDRRVLVMLGLGFSAGLPYLLIFDTLSAWLREVHLSLAAISFFGLTTIFSSLKFLWAPLIDRCAIPFLTQKFGHRRSWMLVAQLAVMVGLWLVAGSDPAHNLGLVALFAVFTGFASATQDIVIDAWRIEAAEEERQGAMAAAYQWGYRVAQVIAGALALLLAAYFGWALSYMVMAALMIVGILSVFGAPRERAHQIRHIPLDGIPHRPWLERAELVARIAILLIATVLLGTGLSGKSTFIALTAGPLMGAQAMQDFDATLASTPLGLVIQLAFVIAGFVAVAIAAWPIPRVPTRPGAFLFHAFGDPLRDFFERHRKAAGMILALICVYRLSENVLNIMNPFYLDLGFSLADIAEVRKLFGVIATVIGVGAGGLAIARWGVMPSLVMGAFAQPVSHIGFIWLATQGNHLGALFVAIGLDNVASGFAGTCLIAYMSSLTSVGFTASQYALFSSLYSLLGKFVASQSGRIVEGTALAAHEGGLFGLIRSLLGGLPKISYAESATRLGIDPAALGAGYIVFFLYTGVLGVAGVLLAMAVAWRERTAAGDVAPSAAAPAPQFKP